MITGLREFRKNMSAYIALSKRGRVVLITDRNEPIASLVSPEKLKFLAEKARDQEVLDLLNKGNLDRNKAFIKNKKEFQSMIKTIYDAAQENSGRVSNAVIQQLGTILSSVENFVSDEATLSDKRMMDLLFQKSHSPISRYIDSDYYFVHSEFLELVKEQINKITKTVTEVNISNSTKNKDLVQLMEMADQAILRKKRKKDLLVNNTCSILLEVTIDSIYLTSTIYSIVPHWYVEQNKPHFVNSQSVFAKLLINKSVGTKINYQKKEYKILSIT